MLQMFMASIASLQVSLPAGSAGAGGAIAAGAAGTAAAAGVGFGTSAASLSLAASACTGGVASGNGRSGRVSISSDDPTSSNSEANQNLTGQMGLERTGPGGADMARLEEIAYGASDGVAGLPDLMEFEAEA